MGCYDSVLVPCPNCNTLSEFQSKSGECLCREYLLENCPEDVLDDVNRHAPNICEKCGIQFYVKLVAKSEIWKEEQSSGVTNTK